MRQHGVRVLSERDLELLRFVGEQYLVTLPQLAYLAGRSERTARWLRTRWQRAGLIDAAKLLVDEPTVIWLTRPGLAALGSGLEDGAAELRDRRAGHARSRGAPRRSASAIRRRSGCRGEHWRTAPQLATHCPTASSAATT